MSIFFIFLSSKPSYSSPNEQYRQFKLQKSVTSNVICEVLVILSFIIDSFKEPKVLGLGSEKRPCLFKYSYFFK